MSFTAGATATSPQLVGFAPRLLHNVAGLIGLYESRSVALGWEKSRLMSSGATRAVVTTDGERMSLYSECDPTD
jgi:hypothetical protein